MKNVSLILIALFTVLSTSSFTVPAKSWQKLGEKTVDYRHDKDVIMVTARDGRFNSIKLKVKKNRVHFKKVMVHYGNGSKEEIVLRSEIRAGGETRRIDLNGKDRIINRVEFFYHTEKIRGKKATVQLFGFR